MRRGQIISVNSVSDHCTSFLWKNSSLYQTIQSNDVNVNKKWSQVLYLWITKIKSIRAHNLSLSIKRQVSNNLFIQLQISNPNSTVLATLKQLKYVYRDMLAQLSTVYWRRVNKVEAKIPFKASTSWVNKVEAGIDSVQGVHQADEPLLFLSAATYRALEIYTHMNIYTLQTVKCFKALDILVVVW